MEEQDYALVYTGFDPTLTGMLARMLEAEGIPVRYIGSQHPAALGIGENACEQQLEVPLEHQERARELIDASTSSASADT
jgi:hypothetical protein